MANEILNFFKKAGDVLYDDPTVQAYCGALQEAYFNTVTGLYKENQKCLIYDFDAIADRVLGNDRTLLPELVCYYKCNDNANNTTVVDIVSGHNAVSSENTKDISTNGAVDRGFSLDGSNPDTITISKDFPRDLSLEIDKEWSIRLILKPESLSSLGIVFSTMTASTQTGIFLFQGAFGQLYLYFVDTAYATNRWTFTNIGALSVDDFKELVITNDGSGLITGVNTYFGGVPSSITRTATGTVSSVANGPIVIGEEPNGHSAYKYSGIVDEIAIWREELSASQVLNLNNSGYFSTYVYSVVLDYLAWQFKVYLWDKSQDPTTKLNMLKQSLKLRGKLGTPWAVKQAIELVSNPDTSDFVAHPIVITEGTGGAFFNGAYNFDGSVNFDSNYSPFKFDVDIPQQTTPSTTDQALFLKAIDSYKNARSWLNDLTFPGFAFGGNTDLSNACIAYYKCDDNAANTTVIDSTGNYHGTAATNTAVLYNASGKINSCFDISGSAGYYVSTQVETGSGDVFDIDKEFFTDFWVYKPTATNNRGLMGNDVGSSSVGLYGLWRGGVGNIALLFRDSTTGFLWQILTSNLPAGWSYVAIGNDGTGTLAGFNVWLNGVIQSGSKTQTGTPVSCASSGPMKYGDNGFYTGCQTTGLDEIGIFDCTPTQALIDARYNSGSGLTY